MTSTITTPHIHFTCWGRHSKVVLCNHKALGKGRACSGSLGDHLTCCAFGTVLCRASPLGSAGGGHKGCGSLAWCRDASLPAGELLCPRRGHGRDRGQRWWPLPPMNLDTTSTAPQPPPSSHYSSGEWLHHLSNTNLQKLPQPLWKCLHERRHNF